VGEGGGKGSFLNSGNLKEFAREMVDRGYREFVIDLANCVMMDRRSWAQWQAWRCD